MSFSSPVLPDCRFNEFSLAWTYQAHGPAMRERIVRFWHEQGAIVDPAEAWRRSFEVGCIVFDRHGEIAGVTSIYMDKLAASGPGFWMFRMFIRPDSRYLGLGCLMLNTTASRLQAQFGHEQGSPAGVCAVIENPKLLTRGGMRVMQRLGLRHIGQDHLDRAVWLRQFTVNPPTD